MSDEQQIFLGLGSNLNDRYKNLKNGIILLKKHPHIWVIDQSHVYQSPAMYNIDQDDFYNMVIKIETNLTPLELLKEINYHTSSARRAVSAGARPQQRPDRRAEHREEVPGHRVLRARRERVHPAQRRKPAERNSAAEMSDPGIRGP